MKYTRVLLKISGEALLGKQSQGIDPASLKELCQRIASLQKKGVKMGIVVGGGNISRGIAQETRLNIQRTPADQMGMLATLINGIALRETLASLGVPVTMMCGLECPQVAEKYQWHKALTLFNEGHILIFSGGTGLPFFTTDTATALRANELSADIVLKATLHVDGVYDKDPRRSPEAKKFERLSYEEFVERKLGVMDLTAVILCMSNQIPLKIFNLSAPFEEVLAGDKGPGTLVSSKER